MRALFRIVASCAGGDADDASAGRGCCSGWSPSRCWCCGTAACCARRAARRAELAALGLVAPAAVPAGWRRHLPPALLLVALVLLVTALARPEAIVPQPRREGTVILAFDVSASMAAHRPRADPDGGREGRGAHLRGAAAGDRAGRRRRVRRERAGHPGADRRPGRACSRRSTGSARRAAPALARGLQTSLSAIVGQPVLVDGADRQPRSSRRARTSATTARPRSSCSPTARTPTSRTRSSVAELASSAGVRVYPIGLGSPEGTVLEIDGFQVATALDEPLLREIAARTDGRYFAAADEQALAAVYDAIELAWTVQDRAHRADRRVRRRGRGCCCSRASACRWPGSGGRCSDGSRSGRSSCCRCWSCRCWSRRTSGSCGDAAGTAVRVLQRRADPGGGPAAVGVAAARARSRCCWAALGAARRGGGAPARQHERAGLGVGADPGAGRVGLDVRDRRASPTGSPRPRPRCATSSRPRTPAPASGWSCSPASPRSRWRRRPTGEPLLRGHRLADHRAGHHHRRRHPQVGRRDRRDQPGGGARRPRPRPRAPTTGHRPAPPAGPRGASRRRSSCCSPTAPTPAASSRWRPPRSPPSAGCGSTRSGSAPATRRRWCAPRPSSAAGAWRAPAPGGSGPRRRRPQLPRRRRADAAGGGRPSPAASTSRPTTPTGCRACWTTSRAAWRPSTARSR